MKKNIEFGQMPNFFPAPVTLVSCKSGLKDNIIPLAWVGIVCSKPPQVSIAIRQSRFSHSLISESREFVINVPTAKMVGIVNGCGSCSGKDTDKFEKFRLTREPAEKVGAPRIGECPLSIECRLKQKITLGSHDLFIGEIVAVAADEKFMRQGGIDYAKIKPLVMMQEGYFSAGKKAGSR